MARIPSSALLLGLAGLLPFLWGGATAVPILRAFLAPLTLPATLFGVPLLTTYGTIILAFMAGVIWGFAAKGGGDWMPTGLALSVLPALWIFAFSEQAGATQILALIAGFVSLLMIDLICVRRRLAPPWWMPLRLLLTGVVVFCLVIGFLFAP